MIASHGLLSCSGTFNTEELREELIAQYLIAGRVSFKLDRGADAEFEAEVNIKLKIAANRVTQMIRRIFNSAIGHVFVAV